MDGILLINKQKGCTSHDVVYKVKKIFNEKVGHTGTLDPNATGVLPLLIGKATHCSKYLINHDKIYKVTLELGKKTTTADIEGEVIEEKSVSEYLFDEKYISTILNLCKGKQLQTPPIYSAIKIKGKKLYEYARKGQDVKIEPREITIYDTKLIKLLPEKNQIEFEVRCSKGTYIRSFCETIAEKLNTIGFMRELERTQVGDFKIENAITVEELEKYKDNNIFHEINKNTFITIEDIFAKNDEISLNNKELQLFINGVQITQNYTDGVYRIYNDSKFIGTGIVKDKLLKRDIIV